MCDFMRDLDITDFENPRDYFDYLEYEELERDWGDD